MTISTCEPFKEAKSQIVVRSGLGVTDMRATSGTVCTRIPNPKGWFVRLRPVARAFEDWRKGLPLDPGFGGVALGWPTKVELDPGFVFSRDLGLPSWEAERAVEGLLEGEPHYIEMAAGLLVDAKGCVLDLASDVSAVLVRDKDFKASVTFRDPVLLFDEGDSVAPIRQ